MKKIILMLFLLASIAASNAQGVKFESDRLPAGENVKFIYDPKGSKLQGLEGIKCNAFVFIPHPFHRSLSSI